VENKDVEHIIPLQDESNSKTV